MLNIVIVEPNDDYGIQLAKDIMTSVPPPILFQVTTNQADAVKLRKPQENQAYIISQRFYINPRSRVLDARVLQLAQDLHDRGLDYERMLVLVDSMNAVNYRVLPSIAKGLGLQRFYVKNTHLGLGDIQPVSELPKDLAKIVGK